MDPRYHLNDPGSLLSPSLLVYRAIVKENLATMIAMAGSADRLRPHVKTHKMPAVVRMCDAMGIHKQKVATIAEAEMTAAAGCRDVLLAYPIVGPNIGRIARLMKMFPETTFRVLADDPDAARALSEGLKGVDRPLAVLVDLEVGMGRTGINPDTADDLCALVNRLPNLKFDGLSAYDGHIKDVDLDERRSSVRPGVERTLALRDRLLARGIPVNRLVMGGTPTFPVHAEIEGIDGLECSPGTCVLQDIGYANKYPDLKFVPAALLLTRVISRPLEGRLCLDLGHKAVAADPPGARLALVDVPDATLGGQSEEHLVVDTPHAANYPPGTPLLALPVHICPTCALHRRAYVIEDGNLVEEWEVAARDRVLAV
jgi:D-serine deaminase-like pyridoxal phosphate-dependent protein